jgi:glucose/arabinose dehydrogenase
MATTYSRPLPSATHPLHVLLGAYPIACFSGAFVTDIIYMNTAVMMWANFSVWLITAGLIMGVAAAVVGIVEALVTKNRARSLRPGWVHSLGNPQPRCVDVGGADRDHPVGDRYGAGDRRELVRDGAHDASAGGSGMMRRFVSAAAASAIAMMLSGCGSDPAPAATQVGANPPLPEQQQYLVPPMKVAPASSWQNGETPTVPAGLKIAALAKGLEHPRQPYVLPNGDILVAEANGPGYEPITRPKDLIMGWVQSFAGAGAKGGNRITLIRDADGDGKPELRTVLVDNLVSPFGMVFVGGYLYVADTDAIIRYPFTPGQTKITAPGTILTELPGGPIDHHWTKSLTASPDGSKLYVGVGSNSNITENGMEAEKNRAAVWEVDRATGAHRVFASGLRNPNGLSFEPTTNKLWVVVNERDEIGPNLVPDYLTSVKEGAFYGWPYSYYGQHVDPRVMPQRPDLVAKAIPPDYALSSHVAPLGLTFYTAGQLPGYQGGAFIGEHGSWDRDPFNGYKVVYVPFANGRPSGKAQDVVTGFLGPNGKARGRPVGVAIDRTGALLVADDLGNTVWRVSAAAPQRVAAR